MRDTAHAVHALVLAGADLAVGGLLSREVSTAVGLVLVCLGVLVLCSSVYRTLSYGRSALHQRIQRV